MVEESDHIQAENKLKKKKKGERTKTCNNTLQKQLVAMNLEKIVKKVVMLCIKWVGWTQTTMECVSIVRETAQGMVDEYLVKKKRWALRL